MDLEPTFKVVKIDAPKFGRIEKDYLQGYNQNYCLKLS